MWSCHALLMPECCLFPSMDWLGARPSAGASVESQALAGVIMIIAGYLTLRTVLRTVRSSVALAFRLLRWGLVLWLVLWLWLTVTGSDQTGAALGSVALMEQLVRASGTALAASALRALSQSGVLATLLQQFAGGQGGGRRSSSRRRSAPRRGTRRGANWRTAPDSQPEAGLYELAEDLGIADWLDALEPAVKEEEPWAAPQFGRSRTRRSQRRAFWGL